MNLHCSILKIRHKSSDNSGLSPRVSVNAHIQITVKDRALTAEYTEKNGTAAASLQTDWRFYEFK